MGRKAKEIKWKINKNDCWECTSHKPNFDGYCRIVIDKKYFYIHRLFYEKYNSKIPKELLVCHKCDNPKCINPNHLFLGTDADNMADKIKKGRQSRLLGENNGRVKITKEQAIEIKYNIYNLSKKELQEKYNLSLSQINKIRRGTRWENLKGAL